MVQREVTFTTRSLVLNRLARFRVSVGLEQRFLLAEAILKLLADPCFTEEEIKSVLEDSKERTEEELKKILDNISLEDKERTKVNTIEDVRETLKNIHIHKINFVHGLHQTIHPINSFYQTFDLNSKELMKINKAEYRDVALKLDKLHWETDFSLYGIFWKLFIATDMKSEVLNQSLIAEQRNTKKIFKLEEENERNRVNTDEQPIDTGRAE